MSIYQNKPAVCPYCGATFQTIITTLDELGYDCEWQVLNSKAYVPQNRERVFIIANLRGEPRLQVFPIGETDAVYPEAVGDNCLDANYGKGWLDHGQRTMIVGNVYGKGENGQVYDPAGICRTLKSGETNNPKSGGVGSCNSPKIIHTAYQGGAREYTETSPTISTPSGGGHLPMVAQALQTDGQLRTGSSWNTNIPQSQRSIRRLTPIECERLQAFPDNWTKYGLFNGVIKEISDTQRYKMMGNAVTTAVITDIKSRILKEGKDVNIPK